MAPQRALRFEWRESFDDFLALEPHWRALEDRVPDRMVFGTFDHMVTLLIQEVAKRIAGEGVRLLVSHGDREYKRYWASEWIPQVRTILFARNLRASASRLARFTIPEWVAAFRRARHEKTIPSS